MQAENDSMLRRLGDLVKVDQIEEQLINLTHRKTTVNYCITVCVAMDE